MKIKSLTLRNFRGYSGETTIEFENLTAFVGRNDIGKSSILEALDVFFNDGKGIIKIDKNDLNTDARSHGDTDICISVCFTDLPTSIIIDTTCETTLEQEHLLNPDGYLEVIKRYPNGGSARVFLRALHPMNPDCQGLLQKKDAELRKIIDEKSIPCPDKTKNPVMRASIWQYYSTDLRPETIDIDVTKGDTKSIWDKLQKYLPLYSLFQADRKNSDGDSEVQDPLKEAVKAILQDESLQQKLDEVATTVVEKLCDVSNRTLAKLQEMNPDIADTLTPVIPPTDSLKWAEVFKNVSISGDESIPINKRGSGTKRLILLNFFRAEVERRQAEGNNASVIYAIEEPETSQHYGNQRQLIHALQGLAQAANTQIIITTHSATIVKELGFDNIRIIRMIQEHKTVERTLPSQLPYPSLNEVNYLAFGEISEEYHDELYGHLKMRKLINSYKQGKPLVHYNQLDSNGIVIPTQKTMTEYIRHQIHHPENLHNPHFSKQDLEDSIIAMRDFIRVQS